MQHFLEMADNGGMKKIILLMTLLILTACNKSSDSEKNELDPRLFEGSGKWQATYYIANGVTYYRDTLTFTGDELQYLVEEDNSGWAGISDTRIILRPIGTKKVATATVEATPIIETWSYVITGNILKVCDEAALCVNFTKI